MRIVIDLQSCQSGSRLGGIGRYSLALAKSMIRQSREHDIWVVLNGLIYESIPCIRRELMDIIPPDRIKTIHLTGPVAEANVGNRFRFDAALLIREYYISKLRPDIVHVSSLFEGLFEESVTSLGLMTPANQTAVTLYDLIPLVERDKYLAEDYKFEWYRKKIEFLKDAGIKLSISEYSRQEAIDLIGLNSDSIVNISSAIDSHFRPIDIPDNVSTALYEKLGVNREFLLFVGSFDQRKNHELLIKGFASLPHELRKKYQLMFVGNGWDTAYSLLHSIARNEGMDPSELVFSGHISDEELLQLYNLCTLFVFPSLREGFGLPVLEAMSCGSPTIGSNTTSIPEVIGMKEALFDPTNYQSIGNKIFECLSNKNFYKKLVDHAVPQASKFSWDQSAQTALDAFETYHEKSKYINKAAQVPISSSIIFNSDLTKKARPCPSYIDLIEKIAAQKSSDIIEESDLIRLANSISKNNAALEAVERIDLNKHSKLRIGWVTTWNSRCGIATYTIPVIASIPARHWIFAPIGETLVKKDGDNVIRSWRTGGSDDLSNLSDAINRMDIEVLVLQFNYGFFDFPKFAAFLKKQVAAERVVFVILHSTQDPPPEILDRKLSQLVDALKNCYIFVHKETDIASLAGLGIKKNTRLLPLGMHEEEPAKMSLPELDGKCVISTYGFALPNKGLIELVDAFARISQRKPNMHLLMINSVYPVPESAAYIDSVKERVRQWDLEGKVTLITDYLSNEDSIGYLCLANLVVIPYQPTTESSSGSARMALASGRPVAVTPIPIFDDMRSAVVTLPGIFAVDMADGIIDTLNRLEWGDWAIKGINDNARLWVKAHGFSSVGRYLFSEMLEAIG